MKNYLSSFLFMVFLSVSGVLVAQKDSVVAKPADKVFTIVERMPQYNGGDDALKKFIKENLDYPDNKKHIKGKVYIGFVVNKDGEVVDAKIMRCIDKKLDQSALAVINKMPKWIPGTQNGKNVSVSFILPIEFK